MTFTTALRPIMFTTTAAILAAGRLFADPGGPIPERATLDLSIRQHRMGTIVVAAPPGTTVQVEQLRHEFWFGASLPNQAFDGSWSPTDTERYKQVFLENFNSAVTEVALKWLSMEPERGMVNYATVDAILAWTDTHRIPLRGHNIYWGSHHWVQPWLKQLDDASLLATLKARGEDIGRRYRGRFAEYDFNNEMIHGDFYVERLGSGIRIDMARWVKAQDPQAILFVNDYDILTGKRLADYIAHIRELLAAGVPIEGIGVQGHLHGDSFDPAALQHSLDELAKLGLPIRVTEFNFPGQRSKFMDHPDLPINAEEEQAKARAIVDYYRICFAHPSVTGILMWGFWEGANWIPQSSLFKRDWTPTPAGRAYRELVYGEWWTRCSATIGADGRVSIPAFFGTYRVTIGGQAVTVDLRKQEGTATATAP